MQRMVYWLAVGWLCRRRLGLGLEELSGTCRRTDGPCALSTAHIRPRRLKT
ncbi:hypothetical protein FA13DRAFT_1731056 [Coprinellus micaceus]|uniref:Uncharacterized protein n=1 Tax=Coprinellus micaceus TaxID=71717 RepID=A0A4Y7TH35_COPMI|nr:hypothetical protein FA13DRAFT_1731056 [Coprinellus micaceus]